MAMQAYVDESGDNKGQSDWLTLVGLIAHAEDWAAFSDEWGAVLNDEPRVNAWHMKEAVNLKKAFRHWSAPERDDRLRRLCTVANRHSITALHCSVDIPAYMEFMAPLVEVPAAVRRKQSSHSRVLHEHPYWLAFQTIIMAVCYELIDQGVTERFEIIFDEKKILGPRVRAWYPALQVFMEPDEAAIMPIEPMFRDDHEFVPLQCCDLLAWVLHRDLVETSGDRDFLSRLEVVLDGHSFDWVKTVMNRLVWSGHRQLFDRERLRGIRQLATDKGITGEQAARLHELAPR